MYNKSIKLILDVSRPGSSEKVERISSELRRRGIGTFEDGIIKFDEENSQKVVDMLDEIVLGK